MVDPRHEPRKPDPRGRILYRFPISHFCEKTQWNLDAKGLGYTLHDLFPGAHLVFAPRHAGGRTVPVLRDGDTVVGDSAAIAAYLDRVYPERPLLPAGEAERARALELEEYFGKRAGRAVRIWMYGQFMANPGSAAAVLFELYPAPQRFAGRVLAPLMELGIRKQYRIDRQRIEGAQKIIVEVFDRIERETGGDPDRYLIGESLSIADISAAALLGPLLTPPGSPWSTPLMAARETDPIRELKASLSARPGWAWAMARYTRDRRAAS
jgi:glutathione S-transferase